MTKEVLKQMMEQMGELEPGTDSYVSPVMNESDQLVVEWVQDLMGNFGVQRAIGEQLQAWKEGIIDYELFRWYMENNLEGMIS